ncbi:Protein MCM10-like protein [Morus notabilis]|uniref:Protein MCM10-like protein n=1 Tax=Morus notabilis TaxID=981085 RepID=W9R6X2_9ROSA|nr:Protein MCM10-like protein [Morus notabilis]
MSNRQDDLDLLLSLQDRVLETPPASPRYCSDDDDESPSRRRAEQADMSVFRDAVLDCLDYQPSAAEISAKSKRTKPTNEPLVEKFSGLRIRNQLVTSAELGERLSDIRFVRLSAIKNLLVGDTLSGCWATVGVLTEKGIPRTSSTGKGYCIWKIACLDEATMSLFLFGDAYKKFCDEPAGTAFAFFDCRVRKDSMGPGFSLSLFSPKQVLKIGTSVDYGICNGKRKDGVVCTAVINKNLRTAFRNRRMSEGIYMVDPLADKKHLKNSKQPVKLLSVEGLKKALRKSSSLNKDSSEVIRNQQLNTKRNKTEKEQTLADKTKQGTGKMIELDYVSSDEGF